MKVEYLATDELPEGIPAAVVAGRGMLTILIARGQTVDQVCAVLTPLLDAHAAAYWVASACIEAVSA
jgi:hypothetical protein